MASKIFKSSVKNALTRSYASQAAAAAKQKSYALPQNQASVAKLTNGAVVAAYDNNSPLSRVAIFVRAGSRYENHDNAGVSHILRICAGLRTKNYFAVGITKQTQQIGGNIVCESGREYIKYEMTTSRENAKQAFAFISDIAASPLFRAWEIKDQETRILTELSARSSATILMDLLHQAAFRSTGLGNSLFIPDHRLGKVTSEELHAFTQSTHTAPRMAFVALGVPHREIFKLSGRVPVESGSPSDTPSSYGGGEIRKETGGPLTHIALVGPGGKIGSEEAASFAVAQFILGGPAGTKYGSGASGKLSSIIAGAKGTGTATAINCSYTDSGLFGVYLVEKADKAGDVVKAIAKGVRTLKITDVDVKNAKAKAKAAIILGTDSNEGELDDMGLQALFTGNYLTPIQVAESLDKVTAASVQSVITNSAKGKLTMASLGNLKTVPFIDQL